MMLRGALGLIVLLIATTGMARHDLRYFKPNEAAPAVTLLSYAQAFPCSCGAACAITALGEVGYQIALNKKAESKAYAVTGMRKKHMTKILQKAGRLSLWQSLWLRVMQPREFTDQRLSPPHQVFEFLQQVKAEPTLWFDPSYIVRLKQDNIYDTDMQLLGDFVAKHAADKSIMLPALEELTNFLEADGRLIVPLLRATSSHYVLLRQIEGRLMVMDPGDGENFEAPADFLRSLLAGEPVDLRFDWGLRFIGAMIGLRPLTP